MKELIKKGTWMSLFCSSAIFASIAPQHIAFEDGEQFNLTLSRLNFNRVYVQGEKIVRLSYPQGAFVVDKSEMEDVANNEASIYLKPAIEIPMTVFFTTDKGHHFSLTITPDEGNGKTVGLNARNTANVKYVKADTRIESEVDDAIGAMKAGVIPDDFHPVKVISRPFYVNKNIKVSLEKHYESERLTGYIYRLENKSTHPVALSTSLFDNRRAESLALSDDTIAPKQVAYLYGLYPHES